MLRLGLAVAGLLLAPLVNAQSVYYPDALWQRKTPAEASINAALLKGAIDFAVAGESRNPRDLTLNHYQTFGREPFGQAIGPIKDRGDQTGVVVYKGYLVAEWGEPSRVDMTHSVTKSLLSSVIGVAYDRGMIRSLDDTVRDYVAPIQIYETGELVFLFETPHNRSITWNHLLRQTSDWEGTLWGKPDWADRPSAKPSEWLTRPRNKAGSVYKYNDVRVNVLAGSPVQSVSGGGHWGGGMFVNAYDMARFGYLTLRRGRWKDRQLLSTRWVDWALEPTPAEPAYGFMNWYNNRDRKLFPSAPASAFAHIGNGTNIVYVDPDHDLVAVVRWIERGSIDEFVKRLLAALRN